VDIAVVEIVRLRNDRRAQGARKDQNRTCSLKKGAKKHPCHNRKPSKLFDAFALGSAWPKREDKERLDLGDCDNSDKESCHLMTRADIFTTPTVKERYQNKSVVPLV